ncbi:MAG: VWA domain-containing protein [Clostridia bacterium]|nr:VWA domain-containing protein [Clostridia bacterium]
MRTSLMHKKRLRRVTAGIVMILLVLNSGATTAFAAMRETVSVTTLHAAVDVDAVADTLLAHSDGIDLAVDDLPQASAQQDNTDLQTRLLQSLEGRRLVAQVKVDDSAALLVTAKVDGDVPQDASVQSARVVTVQNEQGETLQPDGTWIKESQPTDTAEQPAAEQPIDMAEQPTEQPTDTAEQPAADLLTPREQVAKAITGITVIGYNVSEGVQYAYDMRLTGSVLRICEGTLTGYALEVREPEPAPIVPEPPVDPVPETPAPEVTAPETPAQPEGTPETTPDTEVTEPQVPTTDAPATETPSEEPKTEETTEKPADIAAPSAPYEPTVTPETPAVPAEQPAAPAESAPAPTTETSAAPTESTAPAPASDGLAASYTFGPRTVLEAQDGSVAPAEEPVSAPAADAQPTPDAAPVVAPETPTEAPDPATDSTIRGWVVDPDAQPLDKGALEALLGYDTKNGKPVGGLTAWWVGDSYRFTVAPCGVSELDLTAGTLNDKGELLPVVEQFATLTVDNNLTDSTYQGISFPFRVMLNDAAYTGEARLQTVAADGTATEDGTVTFTAEGVIELKPGQRALIEKIATGTAYTVESLAVAVPTDAASAQPVADTATAAEGVVIEDGETPLADAPQTDAAEPEKQTIQLKLEIVGEESTDPVTPETTPAEAVDTPASGSNETTDATQTPTQEEDIVPETDAIAAVPPTGTYVFGPRAVMTSSRDTSGASVSGTLTASAIVRANRTLQGYSNYVTIGQTMDESIIYRLQGSERRWSVDSSWQLTTATDNAYLQYRDDRSYRDDFTRTLTLRATYGAQTVRLGTYQWSYNTRYGEERMTFTSAQPEGWTLIAGGDRTNQPTLLVTPPKQSFDVKLRAVGGSDSYNIYVNGIAQPAKAVAAGNTETVTLSENGSDKITITPNGSPYRILIDGYLVTTINDTAKNLKGKTITFVYGSTGSGEAPLTLGKKATEQGSNTGRYKVDLTVNGASANTLGSADVLVVVDRSNSMDYYLDDYTTTRWDIVRDGVGTMAGNLLGSGSDVRMAVVGYDSYAETLQSWTTDAERIENAVAQRSTTGKGGTNCEAGFKQARQVLANARDGVRKYVLFLSDGVPTYSYSGDSLDGDGSTFWTVHATRAIAAAQRINAAYPDVTVMTLGISSEPGEAVLNPSGTSRYQDTYVQATTAQAVVDAFQTVSSAVMKRYVKPIVLDEMGENVDFIAFANDNTSQTATVSTANRVGSASYVNMNRTITWDLMTANNASDELTNNSEKFTLSYYVQVKSSARVSTTDAYMDTPDYSTGTHAPNGTTREKGWYTNRIAGIGFGGNTSSVTSIPSEQQFPLPVARWSTAVPATLQVTKVDSTNTETKLAGAQFKLIPAIPTTQDDWGVQPDAATINAAAVAFTTSTNGMGAKQIAETGNYWLYETTAPSGYDLPADPWKVAVTEASGTLHIAVTTVNGTVVQTIHSGDTFAVALKNVKTPPQVASLEITKLGENGQMLDGVIFHMTNAAGTATAQTTVNGKVTFADLAVGTYTLRETKTVAGYMLPTKSWTVTVAQDSNRQTIITINNNGLTATLSNAETRLYTTSIQNYKALTLPAAGGPGTAGFTAAGMLLLVGCIPWVRKRETPLEVLLKGVVKK